MKIKDIFLLLRNKNFKSDGKHNIITAFVSGGVQYYQFSGDMPIGRQYNALSFYREFQMRTNTEFLKAHCMAVDNILAGKEITLQGILSLQKLHSQLKERLDFIWEPETAFKLASVVFFDSKENPYSYDAEYNVKKIAKWKKDNDIADFFLQKPLTDLMPALKQSPPDLSGYLNTMREVSKKQLETISTYLSLEQKNAPLFKLLEQATTSDSAEPSLN